MSRTWRVSGVLALGGGLAFWLANFAISLTPLAAEYRAALSIPYVPMLVEALVGGVVLGFCVALPLVRLVARVPATNPITTALVLSGVALTAVTVLIEVPAKFLTPLGDPVRYFLIGALFNAVRILALGGVIGALYGRWVGVRAAPADVSPGRPPTLLGHE